MDNQSIIGEFLNESVAVEEWDKVYRKVDGTLHDPIDRYDLKLFLFNILSCLIGLPANILVLLLVVGSKRPRHVLLLGCVISCIFILFSDLIAVVYYLSHSEYLCRFYVAIYIVPYIDFLYNLLWSLTDRLVAINRSVWHRRKLTRRRVILWKLLPEIVLLLTMKWFFIVGTVARIDCVIHVVAGDTVVGTGLVLFFLCTALVVVVYIETWKRLPRPSRDVPVPLLLLHHPQQQQNYPLELNEINEIRMNVHTSDATLRRMELQVTKSFLASLLPLSFLLLPGLACSITLLYCFHLDNLSEPICILITPWLHYIEKIMTVHALVYPISNLFINKDLASRRPFWDKRQQHDDDQLYG